MSQYVFQQRFLTSTASGIWLKWILYPLLLVLLILMTSAFVQANNVVKFPIPDNIKDQRDIFQQALVELVFSEQNEFTLEPWRLGRAHGDTIHLLRKKQIDFCWAGAEKQLMDEFNHVPFPIFKGLIGYRLMLVTKANQHMLKDVTLLEDLKEFTIGQGRSWADVSIYSANGLKVITTDDYPQLFSMLKKGRFDLFPRSILEISQELENFSDGQLTIADHLMLKYDHAIYFYVSKEKKRLHQYMVSRLNELNQNGGFDKLFSAHYQTTLNQFQIQKRSVIEIENPFTIH